MLYVPLNFTEEEFERKFNKFLELKKDIKMGGIIFILLAIAAIVTLIIADKTKIKAFVYAKWGITGLIVIFIGTCIGMRPDSSGIPDEYGPSDTDKLTAYNYAEDFVKERLKSPSSATFPEAQRKIDNTRYVADGEYRISSYVESYNSFGVMIRADFKCTITLKNGKVVCSNLEIE